MSIYLSGGGSVESTKELDALFFGSIAEKGSILYVPIALRAKRTFQECREWFESVASVYGNFNINILESFNNQEHELLSSDALYIGGGNTYSLLHEMPQSNFPESIVKFMRSGKPVYGGSAGAVVLVLDISTVQHMD